MIGRGRHQQTGVALGHQAPRLDKKRSALDRRRLPGGLKMSIAAPLLSSVVGGPCLALGWVRFQTHSIVWPRVSPARNMQHLHQPAGSKIPVPATPPPLLLFLTRNFPFPAPRIPDSSLYAPPTRTFPPSKHPKPNMQRPSALEPRSFGNNRPSSASPHRLGGGVTSGFRPGSGGARARSARGAGGSSSFLPPAGAMAPAGSQSGYHSHLFSPAALSATYGPLSEAARKVRGM